MSFMLQPWHLLLAILAGWINEKHQRAIEELRTENQILKEKLGRKRILLTDDQRQRLAHQGKLMGRQALADLGSLFTPYTILRWHHLLVTLSVPAAESCMQRMQP
jgi:hypothetical protein